MAFETGIIPGELQPNYFSEPNLPTPPETGILDLLPQTPAMPNFNPQYQAAGSTQVEDPIKQGLKNFALSPASANTLSAPTTFDWERSQADRYVNARQYKQLGFNPNIGQENEYLYGATQTWGDVWRNGFTGMFKLAGNTFIEGWKGWGHMADALTSWDASKLVGTPEQLLEQDKLTKDIMNKYAIFETPDSQKGIFNKSFFGSMLQQSGFAVGTIAQFLSEELLTMGISSAFSLTKLGIKGASWMGKIVKMEEVAKDMKRLGDSVWRSRTFAEGLVNGARKFVPLANTVYDMRRYGKAGAGALQIAAIGVGGVRRTLAEANMAFTEARMEAAGTYGELYNKLYDEELFKTGQAPSALSLERIKENSMAAAQDNFKVNSGILMVMNRIQFDNMFSKFKFGRSVLGEAGGFADDVVKVTGKRIGKEAGEQLTKTYTKGALGTLSTIGRISADFGGRKAAWEATKAIGRNVFKWEASEGIQELLQEGSNVALQDYYYDLYHGYKGGGWDKSISKAVDSQANIQGLKTFLMGALTGRLLSPMNFAIGKAKLYAGTTAEQRAERKVSIQDAVKQVNAFYENPNKYLPEHIANIKVQNRAAQNMEEAIANRDEYVFHNNKDSAFAKMLSSSIKLGMFESTLDTLRGYGETFDEKDFKEAFGMELTDANRSSVKEFFNKIATDAEEFHKNWKTLKERYGDLVKPEIYEEGTDEHKMSLVAKRALDDALEILATNDHKARRNVIRAVGLQQKMSGIPVIGGSAAIAFRNLGVIENTEKEIELLENEIKELDAIPKKDKIAKDRLKVKKQQLKALQNWKENHAALKGMGRKDKRNFKKAMKAFENYMNSKNLESEIDVVIKQDDLQDMYKNLIDYIELNNDNKEYVDAYNILANPMQFVNIHKRLMDAIEHTRLTKLAEHLQEMINEAQGKPPVKEDQPGAIVKHTVRPETDGTFSVISPKGTVVGKDLKTLEDAQVIADTLDEALEKKKKAAETSSSDLDFVPPGLAPGVKVLNTKDDVFLIQETDPKTNDTIYYIVDKEGDWVSHIKLNSENFPLYQSKMIYTDYDSAKKVFDDLIAQSEKDNSEFKFGQFTLRAGTILLDGKNKRYKVLSKGGPQAIQGVPKISILNIENPSSKPENKSVTELKDFRLESEVETVPTVENPNAFRLLRNNELLRIYPHVNKQIGESRLEAEKRLEELILNTPASVLAAGLSIVVNKNAQVTESRFAADAEGNNENKNLKINGEPYSIALVYQGQTIGYLPYYNQYKHVDKGGIERELDKLTYNQFQEIFKVGKDSTVKTQYDFFVSNYKQSVNLYNAILNELPKGQTSVTLTPDVVNTLFNVQSLTGEYAYAESRDTAPSLKDLKYNTIDGYVYIIDRRTRHLGDMMYANDEVVRTNAPRSKKEAIDKKVKEARFKADGSDRLKKQGRYVAAVELPNGKIRFVELSSYNVSREDLNIIVENFNNQSKKLKEENLEDAVHEVTKKPYKKAKDPSLTNDINNDINNNIYITIPSTRGTTVSLMLTPTGDIKIEFSRYAHGTNKSEKAVFFIEESQTDPTKPLLLKDINDLIDRINRGIDAYDAKPARNIAGVLNKIRPGNNNFKIGLNNFIKNISESFSPDEYTNLRTNTKVEVVKNVGLTLTRKPSDSNPRTSTATKTPQSSKKTNVPSQEDLEGVVMPDDVTDAQQELIKQRMAEIAKRNQERQAELDRIEREKKERAGKIDVVDQVADLQKQRADIVYELEGQLLNQKDENGNPRYTRKQIRTNPIFKTDPRIIAIDQQIAELNDPNNAALKVSSNLSEENVNDINEFRQWMQEHLPEFISVEDMQVLSEKMKEQGVTVGMFYMQLDKINNVLSGKVAVTKTTAWKYHEAFHSIFRMLLTDEKIDQLLKIARKELLQQGKSISTLKKELLESKPAFYSQFTDKELEERVYEEYLADKFNEWKRNIKTETSPVNKSIFRKFLDFILNFFKALRRSPLEKLFMNIEKGKFKNSQVVANRFTNSVMLGVTEPALKAIQIGTRNIDNIDGKREAIPVYLSQEEGNVLSSTIAALYHKRMTEAGLRSHSDEILEQILDDYANLYDQRLNPYYDSDDFYEKYPTQVSYENALTKIRQRYDMFNNDELREILKDAVKVHTKIMGYQEKDYTDDYDSEIDDYGDRATTDNRKEAFSVGGYGSMAKELRQYLSTIVEEVTDEFGNTAFVSRDGQITNEPLIQAANANVLYNGLLKAASGSMSAEEVLEKFEVFAKYNPEANKFWHKFSKDVDLQYDEDGNFVDIGNKKQANLFQLVVNGFQQHMVDYFFINKDIGKKKVRVIEANRRGAAKNQFSIWYNAYLEKFVNEYHDIRNNPDQIQKFLEKKTDALEALVNLLNKGTVFNEEDLEKDIKSIITDIKNELGISLSPLFIKYSYLKSISIDPNNPANLENMKILKAYDYVDPMTEADARELMSVIKSLKNPFGNNLDPDKLLEADAKTKSFQSHEVSEQEVSNPEDGNEADEDVTDDVDGAIGRLTKLASSNAVFDEQVATTSFKNGENQMVYSHQMPTFNLIRGKELQNENFREELKKDPFLKTNFLLNNPLFEAVADFFTVARIESIKDSTLTENANGKLEEDKRLNVNQGKGITYGSMSDREFIISLIELYGNGKVRVTPRKDRAGLESFMTSSVLMGVIEASNTGDLAHNIPIIKAVKFENGVSLTDTAKQALYNEIVREYERIQRTQSEIDNRYPRGLIDGYHNGDPEKGGQRGLRFIKMRNMLGDMVEELQQSARAGEPISANQRDQIFKNIENYWMGEGGQLDGLINDLIELNVLGRDANNELKNILLSDWVSRGYRDSNGKPDVEKNNLANISGASIRYNLGQVLISNYINALSVNQLFIGDVAESFKDDEGIDETKRNKPRNGSGADISSIITAPELGITHANKTSHVVTFEDGMYKGLFAGKNKEKADAQMYMTVKALRYTLFGLGKLNAAQAELLDKIERGQSVSVSDVFGEIFKDANGRKSRRGGSIQFNAQTNSLKLLYADGKRIIKTSAIVLTRELTSLRDGSARPEVEGLHKLRERLELFEKENETIAFGIPKSASKGKKVNIASSVDAISNDNFIEHDNRFWRLQLENPSNKTLITDPTQAKQSIIAEQYEDLEVMFEGESMKLGDVIDTYLSDTEQRVKNNYFNARNEIFDIKGAFKELGKSLKQNQITPLLGKFLEKAVKTLSSTGADPQTIEFFTPLKDKTTGELSQVYDLNHPLTLDKFTQLFLAHFSKGVMSEKIPGHSLTLVSNWNMQVVKRVVELDENGQPKRWENVTRRQYEKDSRLLAEARNAKRWNNELDREFEGLQVGDLYIDDLRHNVPEYDEKGNIIGYFSEFMMPPHFREDMRMYNEDGTLSDAALKAFGVRIPSQDKHSAISLKLVDFLPAHYGSIGVFPHELIEISGADFDVDKLYMHIMDTYHKDGKRIPYGSAKTKEEKFAEYVMYLSKKDRAFKLKLREIEEATSVTYNDELDVYDVDDFDENDSFGYENINDLMHDLFSSKESAKSLAETNALIELGLPSTADEYAEFVKKYGEQNNGVLNNRILAAKLKLINNEGMVKAEEGKIPVAFQVAEVQPLLDAIERFIDEFPTLNNVLIEKGADVDSLRGMFRSFKNNKEGSRNIGPAVNAMLAASLMNAFKVRLRTKDIKGNDLYVLNIDGKDFDSYENARAWDNETKSYSGERVFYHISAIVSAMTDNAKERLAARLGLNINAVDVVSNMVALGVPLETALMFNLQPSVREFYKRISVTNKNIKTAAEQDIYKSTVGQELLNELSKKRGDDTSEFNITTEILRNNIKSEGDNANVNFSVFNSFLKFYNQTQSFSAVAQVLKLSKGLGTNNEAIDKIEQKEEMLGLNLSDVEFSKTQIPFDLRQVLTGADESRPHHKITANYIKIKNQIKELQKSIMIEKTYMFKRIREAVLSNLKVHSKEKERFEKELKRNIISYLGIKAYMQALKKSGKGEKLAGLTNALIYDAEAVQRGENFKDIIDTVREARELLKDTNDGKGNYFVEEFLNIVPVTMPDMAGSGKVFPNPKNKGGINVVEANTWAKLGELEVNKIKDSFLEMYSNPKTRPLVYNLYNYLLVKDGGQFTNNSFIRFMPPVIFKELLDATRDAHQLLKNDNLIGLDEAYVDVFGATSLELFNEFTTLYSTNKRNSFNMKEIYPKPSDKSLKNIKKSENLKGYSPKVINVFENKIRIDLFNGIRETELKIVTDEMGKEYVIEAINTGKFNEIENEKFNYNQDLLEAMNFNITKREENGKNRYYIELPYTIKVNIGDFTTGKNYVYYKLSSVSKKKDSKSSPGIGNFIMEVDDNTALASVAVYEKFEPTGSKNQWKVGGLTGEMPTAVSLRNRFGKQRKSKYDDIRMQEFETFEFIEPDFDTDVLFEGHAEDLFREYGISVRFVDSKITFFKPEGSKQIVYETTARTPDELYKMLKQQAGEPVESRDVPDFFREIPNFGEESNPFAGGDFGDIQMQEQSPEDAERTANILREKMKQKKVQKEVDDLKKDNDNCNIG